MILEKKDTSFYLGYKPVVSNDSNSLYIEFYLTQERLDNLNPLILQELSKQNLNFISDIKEVTQVAYEQYQTEYGIEKAKFLNEQIKKFYEEIITNTNYIFKQKPILNISTGKNEPQEIMYSDKDNTLYIKPKKEVKNIECNFVISKTADKIDISLNEAKKKKTVKLIDFNYQFMKDTFGDLKIQDIVVTKDYSPELDIKYQINSNNFKDINLNRYYYLIHEYENIFAVYQILINKFEVSIHLKDSNLICFFKVPETCRFYSIKNPLLYSNQDFALTYCSLLNEQLNEAKKNIDSYLESAEFDLTMDRLMNERNKDNLDKYLKNKPQNLDFDKGFELTFVDNSDNKETMKKFSNWYKKFTSPESFKDFYNSVEFKNLSNIEQLKAIYEIEGDLNLPSNSLSDYEYQNELLKEIKTTPRVKIEAILCTKHKMDYENIKSKHLDYLESTLFSLEYYSLRKNRLENNLKKFGVWYEETYSNFDDILKSSYPIGDVEKLKKEFQEMNSKYKNRIKNQVNIPSQLVETSKQINITKGMPEYQTDPIINFFKTPDLIKDYQLKVGDKVKSKKPLEFSVNNLGFECSCLNQDVILQIVEFIYNWNNSDNFIKCSYKGKNLPIYFKASDLELVEITQDSIQAKKEYMNQEYEDFEGIILQDQTEPTTKEIFVI